MKILRRKKRSFARTLIVTTSLFMTIVVLLLTVFVGRQYTHTLQSQNEEATISSFSYSISQIETMLDNVRAAALTVVQNEDVHDYLTAAYSTDLARVELFRSTMQSILASSSPGLNGIVFLDERGHASGNLGDWVFFDAANPKLLAVAESISNGLVPSFHISGSYQQTSLIDSVPEKYTSYFRNNLTILAVQTFSYRGKNELYSLDHAGLARDPVLPYLNELFAIEGHVGYFITPIYHYYGLVRSGETRIILGPTRQLPATRQQLRELAFLCDVPREGTDAFVDAMGALSPLPLESLLQVLCALNYVLNGEKLGLEDIAMSEAVRLHVRQHADAARDSAAGAQWIDNHNTLAMEETLMRMIREGDVPALQAWIAEAPAVHAGTMATDHLRQYRNTFIVSATLAAGAAIRGGMGVNEALSLSDLLIRNCEAVNDVQSILSMQAGMMLTYAEQVRRVHMGKHPTPLAAGVARYVQRHLSEVISADAMAAELHLSRPHLSRQFKADTGMTLPTISSRKNARKPRGSSHPPINRHPPSARISASPPRATSREYSKNTRAARQRNTRSGQRAISQDHQNIARPFPAIRAPRLFEGLRGSYL